MGSEGKRKIRLHRKTNAELLQLYDAQLILRHRSQEALDEARRVLNHFRDYLGEFPPSPEIAASFLARFADRKTTTLYRYHSIIKTFMEWYGEKLDTKIRVEQGLPDYVETEDIEKLINAIKGRKSHKQLIERNLLIIDVANKTGLRREEISNLTVGNINLERGYIEVREGKGGKDRIIDLTPSLQKSLAIFIKGKNKDEKVFGMSPSNVSYLVHWAARKAGVDIHTHSLRHFFGQSLVDTGTDLETVRRLMGHSSLRTTQVYIGRTDKQRREAISRLEQAPVNEIAFDGFVNTTAPKPVADLREGAEVSEKDKNGEGNLERNKNTRPIREDEVSTTSLESKKTSDNSKTVERTKYRGRYAAEWEHFDAVKEAIIGLHDVSVEQRGQLLSTIQRERDFLDDEKLQNALDLFIMAIMECTNTGMTVTQYEVEPTMKIIVKRMNKRYRRN